MKSEIDQRALRERISELMKSERPTPWAHRIGLSSATWNRFWVKGEPPTMKTLQKIAVGAGVSLRWLMSGDEASELQQPDGGASVVELGDTPRQSSVRIPFFNVRVSAGPGSQPIEEQQTEDFEISRLVLRRLGVKPSNVIALPVHGDSAEPYISDGDVILVDRGQIHLQDGYLYVIGVDQDVVVKRVERLIDKSILLKSDNPAYQSQRVPPDAVEDLRVIGRVRWAFRYF